MATKARKRYEYAIEILPIDTPPKAEKEMLNELGSGGWLLVSVVADGGGQLIYYFQREIL